MYFSRSLGLYHLGKSQRWRTESQRLYSAWGLNSSRHDSCVDTTRSAACQYVLPSPTYTSCRMYSSALQACKPHVLHNGNLDRRKNALLQHASLLAQTHNSPSFHQHRNWSLYSFVNCAREGLCYFHDVTGLPWWATIIITTVLFRNIVTLPFTIYGFSNQARLAELQPFFEKKERELRKEAKSMVSQKLWKKEDAKYHILSNMMKYKREVYIRENVHPAKTFLTPWFQLPMWLCLSWAYRDMTNFWYDHDNSELMRPDMGMEGVLWFDNLLIPDPTYLLPLIMTATSLTINEVYALQNLNPHWSMNCLTWGLRIFSIALFPFFIKLPAAMTLYWTTSVLVGLVHNLITLSPKFRRFFGIDVLPGEKSRPYKHILDNGKLRNERILKAIRAKIGAKSSK